MEIAGREATRNAGVVRCAVSVVRTGQYPIFEKTPGHIQASTDQIACQPNAEAPALVGRCINATNLKVPFGAVTDRAEQPVFIAAGFSLEHAHNRDVLPAIAHALREHGSTKHQTLMRLGHGASKIRRSGQRI